jgi:ABC-type branched-subunit amino acid transport system ATPase component
MTARLLELKSLTKKFGGILAVYDLSFHVDEGESRGGGGATP